MSDADGMSDRELTQYPAGGGRKWRPVTSYQPAEELEPNGWAEEGDEGVDLREMLKTVIRWRWLILAVGLLGILISVVAILRTTPLYKANATIEIRKEETQIIESGNIEPVAIADAEYMATQYALLQSRSLAEDVAESLGLASDERYADQTLERPVRLDEAVGKVLEGLSVSPIGRSRVIEVGYISPYPSESARISNAIVEGFIQSNLERKFNATAYARRFIEERLQATKIALEESERQLVAYAEEQGILDLSDAGGSKIGASLDATTLSALNAALADAQTRRVDAELRLQEMRSAEQSGALENQLIENLSLQRSALAAEYRQKRNVLKPEFPEMQRLTVQMEELDAEIAAERERIVSRIEGELRTARSTETSIAARINESKEALQSLRNRSIEYNIHSREVDTNRSQYEALLQRLKEVSIAGGVGTSQVAIVDQAIPPKVAFSPNVSRSLVQGFILSLALGIGLAFALEYLDDTIKDPSDTKSKLGVTTIGLIPYVKGADPLNELMNNVRSPLSEAIASARTALQFSTSDGIPRSLLVTSVRPGEGKTSTSAGFGVSFARIGLRVLIIDADMRKPSFVVDADASVGLSGLLTQDRNLMDELVGGAVPNLFLLPCGVVPPSPAELLASGKLASIIQEAEQNFDVVIIDSPPMLGFADAAILADRCEATVMVVQSGAIRRQVAQRNLERLREANANVVGVILSKFKSERFQYGYDYDYHYGYETADSAGRKVSRAMSEESTKRQIELFKTTESDVQVDDDETV